VAEASGVPIGFSNNFLLTLSMTLHNLYDKYFIIRYLALAVLIFVILLNATQPLPPHISYLIGPHFRFFPPTEVGAFEDKMVAIKQSLLDLKCIGYVWDNSIDKNDRARIYYLSQYTFAPKLLKLNTNSFLLLGNFPNGIKCNQPFMDQYYIYRRYSDGFYLFKRKQFP